MKNKILIVSSNYYADISSNLIKGATEELKMNNLEFEVLYAPGCFEIPFLISKNIKKYREKIIRPPYMNANIWTNNFFPRRINGIKIRTKIKNTTKPPYTT